MEVLLLGLAVVFVALPIIILIMLINIGSRITNIEDSLSDLKRSIGERLSAAPERPAQAVPQWEPRQEAPPEPAPAITAALPQAESRETPETAAADGLQPAVLLLSKPAQTDQTNQTARTDQTVQTDRTDEVDEAGRDTVASRVASSIKRLTTWLIDEGNIWVTVGVLLFLAGFGLLFNYVVRRHQIPLELRLLAGAVVSIAMTGFGWKMRDRRRTYALILQGGGIALLYVVLLAGVRMGPVIPPAAAIVGMILLSTFSIALALLQDFELLAIFALLGGYMAPILISTGSSNFVALFSIYSLLNFEILLISMWRDWRKTRWGGLLASVVVGAAWGALRWQDEYFSSVEPFLILFFINYSAIALIPTFRERLAGFVKYFSPRTGEFARADMPMAAALPFVFLSLQMAAASHTRYGVALTCLALGAWYLALGVCAARRGEAGPSGVKPRLFLIYCLIFSNLAVPFIFRQALSSCVWAIEGTLLAAYAVSRKDWGAMMCGVLLHAFAFLLYNFAPFLHLPGHLYVGIRPAIALLNWRDPNPYFLLTALIFAVSAFGVSCFASMAIESEDGEYGEKVFSFRRSELFNAISWGAAVYGTAWWTAAAVHAADFYLGGTPVGAYTLLYLGALAAYEVSCRAKWPQIRVMAVPATAAMLREIMRTGLSSVSALNWLAAALMSFRAYLTYRDGEPCRFRKITWTVTLFMAAYYSSWAWTGFAYRVFGREAASGSGGMLLLAGFLPIALSALLFLNRRFGELANVRMDDYRMPGMIAVTALMALKSWSFLGSALYIDTGAKWFLPYIPLLNPMELWQALYIATAGVVIYEMGHGRARTTGLYAILPFVVFLWLNSVAARTAWEWFGETVSMGHVARAPYFQGITAILWGFTALALIQCGKKYSNRYLWFTGAALLAADIAKLLLVDLRNSATVIRILAFLLLGGLFLLIGWISPLPPKDMRDTGAAGVETEEEKNH
ncbi:MAG: DUF2339 domain-containing protein [Synergistaceae bacterium]|jgi:uncharacterized membrane protein|nr:DUF2339 domain-containing protein [Synergistaceae bacterium]